MYKSSTIKMIVLLALAAGAILLYRYDGLIEEELAFNHRQLNAKQSKRRRRVARRSSLIHDDQPTVVEQGEEVLGAATMMGYNKLSCPFEWSKYSCSYMQENNFDKQVANAAMQYYQQHLAEIRQSFDSLLDNGQQHQPTRIFMTGDSLLRQVFISIACNAHSLYDNVVEQVEVQWRKEWPCPPVLSPQKCLKGGQHSGFDAASIRFKNGSEIHYVPHAGNCCNDTSKIEPDMLQRLKEQIDSMGTIDFGTKTAFPPSGQMDVLVYNVGIHAPMHSTENTLNYFVENIATPLMEKDLVGEQRPKIIYVSTPTQHFNTLDGEYKHKKKEKCAERVLHNPRAELEKRVLKPGVTVDVLIEHDDLELGGLHVQKGDCAHYCMPGVPDSAAARLLKTFIPLNFGKIAV